MGKKNVIEIKRPKTLSDENEKLKTIVPNTGGITLPQTSETETDPFKVELIRKGYLILKENEYGAIVRLERGKPFFLARTANGYLEESQGIRILLPFSLNTAVKIRMAGNYINASHYLTELIMEDLRKNKII